MKILLPEHSKNTESRKVLFYEAEVGLQLQHDNVIRITKVNKSQTSPFFVMEFFPSGSLRARLQAKEYDFIKDKAHSIFFQAATGLAYMNAKDFVHRDIKPDNLLVNSAGTLKIIDFAIAQKPPTGLAAWFVRRQTPQGTRSYMSPEQIRGEILDGRADIYSYGATLYELTTYKPPFRGKDAQDLLTKHIVEKPVPPKTHVPTLSTEFSNLVIHMLAKKKTDRPKSFHEILMALKGMRIYTG
jgi:serine/threonine protein kinase